MGTTELVIALVTVIVTVVVVAFSMIATLLALLAGLAIPVAVFYFMFKAAKQRSELLKTGEAAPAKVISVRETGMYVNNQPQVSIGLEVQPLGCAPFNATVTQTISFLAIPRIQPGAAVEVRFDPQNHAKIAIAGI